MAEIASSVIRPLTMLAVGALALAGRASGQTSLSIYSVGRVVVRRTLPQALENGRSTLTLKIDGLDPATPHSSDTPGAQGSAVGVDAAPARPPTELAYVTQGASWEAVYQVVLTGGRCQVSGAATIASQSVRADSAQLQLVAGAINRGRPGPRPEFEVAGFVRQRAPDAPAPAAGEVAVGETHVYLLPARVALEPGTPVTTAL